MAQPEAYRGTEEEIKEEAMGTASFEPIGSIPPAEAEEQ
jgi:hypothetical protein